jgi:hypothetical protein
LGIEIKKYNLKKEYNWRGDVAELLTRYYLGNLAYRTKGNRYKSFLEIFPGFRIKKEHERFLRKHWRSIDLFWSHHEGNLIIYEVKTRNSGVKRRPDLTQATVDCFEEALKLGIQVFVVTVYFHDDWEISFEVNRYRKEDFRVNNGGYYR